MSTKSFTTKEQELINSGFDRSVSTKLRKYFSIDKETLDKSNKLTQEFFKENQQKPPVKKNLVRPLIERGLYSPTWHPYIPNFYYDLKDKTGNLFVKDFFNGDKLINKNEAILLSNGRYGSADSPKLVDSNSSLLTELLSEYQKTNSPVKKARIKNELESLWLFYNGGYIPFLLEDCSLVVGQDPLKSYLLSSVNGRIAAVYRGTNYIAEILDSAERHSTGEFIRGKGYVLELIQETLVQSLERILSPEENFLEVPLHLKHKIHLERLSGRRITLAGKNLCIVGDRVLSQGYMTIDLGNPYARQDLEIIRLDALSFKIILPTLVESSSSTMSTSSKKTRNNAGELLQYSAKVNEYKKMFTFSEKEKKDDKNACFMGLELECVPRPQEASPEGHRKIIQDIADSGLGDHCIMKSDSSIGTLGLEIVTVAATLKRHKEMFANHFFAEPNKFQTRVQSTNQCGIHVHISKKSFTKLSMGKFVHFMNAIENRAFITEMAGRELNSYCRPINLRGKNGKGFVVSASIGRHISLTSRNEQFERNSTVNVNRTSETAEVRIFKSTNVKSNLFRKLEFCDALVKFCKVASIQQLNTHDFVDFILRKENRKEYYNLLQWLASHKYVSSETVRVKNTTKFVNVFRDNLIPEEFSVFKTKRKRTN